MNNTTEPWTADRLSAVLAAAAHEHFASLYETTLVSQGNGTAETYEAEEPDDPDNTDAPLVLVRESDGARFEVEFWANVTRLRAAAPAAAGPGTDGGAT